MNLWPDTTLMISALNLDVELLTQHPTLNLQFERCQIGWFMAKFHKVGNV